MLSSNKLSLGFSSCPNDTFIFDAMVNGKIDTEGLDFSVVVTDVEALNEKAMSRELDITKLSFFAYGFVSADYILLESGSALGKNCGPLLIAKKGFKEPQSEIAHSVIAVPGQYTTANFLFSLAFPQALNKKQMLFSKIEEAVLFEEADVGVIIHENRFTYQLKGLKKIADLGEYWENAMGLPIPLGGIAVKRDFSDEVLQKISRVMRRSVDFALDNPESGRDYVNSYAGEMDEAVIKKHINLYVNQYTVQLGENGLRAIEAFFEKAVKLSILEPLNMPLIFEH